MTSKPDRSQSHAAAPHAAVGDAGENFIDIHQILGMLWGGRWVLLACMLLAATAGWYKGWSAAPVYISAATLHVEKGGGTTSVAALEQYPQSALFQPSQIEAELATLKSRAVVGKVVDQLRLRINASGTYAPYIGRALARDFRPTPNKAFREPLLGMEQYAWGGEEISVTDIGGVNEDWHGSVILIAQGEGAFEVRSDTGERLGGGSVGAETLVPHGNTELRLFVQELRARPGTEFMVALLPRSNVITGLRARIRAEETSPRSGLVRVSLAGQDPQRITRIINELIRVYQRQNAERKSAEAEQSLEFLRRELPKLRAKLERSEDALNAYRLRQGSANLTKETELVLQQSVSIEEARVQLQQQREEAMRRYTPEHPVVVGLDAQITQLKAERDKLSSQIQALPETQQRLLRLKREVEVDTGLYTALLNNAQELELIKAGTVSNVRIIDDAIVPVGPSGPRKRATLIGFLVVGLIVGVLIIVVRRALHLGVHDPLEIERELGLPSYGSIPYSPLQTKLLKRGTASAMLAVTEPNSPAIEALRSLRTALHFASLDAENNVVMLTGPSPNLGKSFCSINLAAVMAMGGARTLVVDADMRRGHLHAYTGLSKEPGLSDFLAGDADLSAVVRKTAADNLFVVTRGTNPPNPSELLMSSRFERFIAACSDRFDHVIVDSPPVLAVADAGIIGRRCGATLVVLKAGEHPMRMIQDTVQRLDGAGVEVKGVVLNQVGRGASSYAYGYGYAAKYTYDYASRS